MTNGKHKVLVILSKSLKAKEYEQIVKIGKKVSIDDVLHKISQMYKLQTAQFTMTGI